MNILYITQSGFALPSAETTHAIEIIKSFKNLGHTVDVAFSGGAGSIGSEKLVTFQHRRGRIVPWRVSFQLWLLWEFLVKGEIKGFDCIYVRQSALMVAPSILRLFSKFDLITEFNTVFSTAAVKDSSKTMSWIVLMIEKLTVSYSTKVVAVSSTLLESLKSKHKFPKRKIRMVSNGCNVTFMAAQNKKLSREKYGINTDSFVIGFVGHLHPWQGVDALIETVALLSKTRANVVAVLAGTADDISKYKKHAQVMGVEKKVLFLGAVPYKDIPVIISCFDVGVAPGAKTIDSNYVIRSPLKVFEYLANSKPVISGYLPSLERLFSDDEVGFLVTSGNSEEIAECVEKLILNPELLKKMGMTASEVAQRDLSWDSVAAEILG